MLTLNHILVFNLFGVLVKLAIFHFKLKGSNLGCDDQIK